MKVQFFEKELQQVQERFNRTFGVMLVCDLRLRQSVILSICHLGYLTKKMAETKSRDQPHNKIERFNRARNVLNRIFDQLEKEQAKITKIGTNYYNQGTPLGADQCNGQKTALP